MRLRHLSALTLGTLAVLAGFPTPPASAATYHTLQMDGYVDIFDDEPWPRGGVWCRSRRVFANGAVDHGLTNTAWLSDRDNTCDGEVRVEFEVSGVISGERLCGLQLRVFLYGGTSTSSTDLDGKHVRDLGCLDPGWKYTITGNLPNVAEGGDKSEFQLVVTHFA